MAGIKAVAVVECIAALKAGEGRETWLFGGGRLAGLCFRAGLVDTVETTIMPVLPADGIGLIEMAMNTIGPHATQLALVRKMRLEREQVFLQPGLIFAGTDYHSGRLRWSCLIS